MVVCFVVEVVVLAGGEWLVSGWVADSSGSVATLPIGVPTVTLDVSAPLPSFLVLGIVALAGGLCGGWCVGRLSLLSESRLPVSVVARDPVASVGT